MKDNFLLKTSQISVFKELSDEDAGKLIKGIFDYVKTKEITLNSYLKVIFIPIKEEIDKNQERYEKQCEINKENGKKGGAPKGNQNAKKTKTTENNQTIEKTTENNMTRHNHNHNHNHIKEIYYNNIELNNLFIEYLELRKKLKCKNTERAIKLLQNKLDEYDDKTKIEMLNNAIMNSWKSVYPIKKVNAKKEPSWLNQEIKSGEVKLSEEELEWLKSIE